MAEPLAEIFNKCLTAGVFPDDLKIAQVTPIYKKGCKHDLQPIDPYQFCLRFQNYLKNLFINVYYPSSLKIISSLSLDLDLDKIIQLN